MKAYNISYYLKNAMIVNCSLKTSTAGSIPAVLSTFGNYPFIKDRQDFTMYQSASNFYPDRFIFSICL
nr:hypothetical protein [uncultured Lacibacter sp.]